VHEEFVRSFERETAGPRDRYAAVAAEILTAYQKFAESIRCGSIRSAKFGFGNLFAR
jgi:hypothetical protein